MINNALDGLKLSQTIKNIKIMGRELSDVFKAKTRVGKRKVLDKFDISKEDKNKFLNGIEDVGSEGGGNGEASNIEYLNVSGLEQASTLAKIAISVKWSDSNGKYTISPWGLFAESDVIFKAVAIDLLVLIYNSDFPTETNFITLGEFMTNMGMQLNVIPRLTKEQFYSLE